MGVNMGRNAKTLFSLKFEEALKMPIRMDEGPFVAGLLGRITCFNQNMMRHWTSFICCEL
jgi:hypothetical protein